MITNYDYSKIENYEELRKLQLTQLKILEFFDGFCSKNNLKYSIVYGTLLGAVRHGGSIPWDDDIDVCMPREDYDKFLSLWKDTDEYLVQNNDISNDFSQSFLKIRKKNTAFVQKTDLGKEYHKGIFVDVFPFDKVPKSKLKKTLQIFHAMLYQLYIRGYSPENERGLLNVGSKFLLKLTPKKKYRKAINKHYKKIVKYSNDDSLNFADFSVYFI